MFVLLFVVALAQDADSVDTVSEAECPPTEHIEAKLDSAETKITAELVSMKALLARLKAANDANDGATDVPDVSEVSEEVALEDSAVEGVDTSVAVVDPNQG